MTRFRLLADDLTGALDSAARFCGAFGPIPVAWADDPAADVLALDSGTREVTADVARARVADLAPALAGADLAFKKLDSLLRGHVAGETAACLHDGRWDAVVIAPAFPAQGRVMRHWRQLAHGSDVGVDLVADLAHQGVPVARRRAGDDLPPGVSLWDAETDAELAAIAALRRRHVLWCGTAGLAGALVRTLPPYAGALPTPEKLQKPVIALVGSAHPVALTQLAACQTHVRLAGDAPPIPHGTVVTVALPEHTGYAEAAERIAATFTDLLARMDRPGTLIVTGGETLRAVCQALDAQALVVDGEVAPGIARSRLRGGRWDGLSVVSKSGAFGDAGLLARLLDGGIA